MNLNQEEYILLKDQFDRETNVLLNRICDTFHNELDILKAKYGSLRIEIKVTDDINLDIEDEI